MQNIILGSKMKERKKFPKLRIRRKPYDLLGERQQRRERREKMLEKQCCQNEEPVTIACNVQERNCVNTIRILQPAIEPQPLMEVQDIVNNIIDCRQEEAATIEQISNDKTSSSGNELIDFKKRLAVATLKTRMKHRQTDAVLKVLRTHGCFK